MQIRVTSTPSKTASVAQKFAHLPTTIEILSNRYRTFVLGDAATPVDELDTAIEFRVKSDQYETVSQ